jgi:hypothetical protein
MLNLDAEDELARPAGYTPSRAVQARVAALRTRLQGLVPAGDVVLAPEAPALPSGAVPGEFEGRAWCPTPRALRAWCAAGVTAPPVPPLAVLRRVNHRAFCAALGQTLPGARFVTDWNELRATVACSSPTGQWLLKRPFGYTARGRLRVRARELDGPARAWIAASLSRGEGLQVEPWVERAGDVGLHGFVAPAGGVTLGAPTVQAMDAAGAWTGSTRAAPGALADDEWHALYAAAEEAAAALHTAGYFGPFGIDAFRWIDAGGTRRFNPRCEINARYSMGWAVGMGSTRPDL